MAVLDGSDTGSRNGSGAGAGRFSRPAVAEACLRLLGRRPDSMDDPAGLHRKSIGVAIDGRRIIVSRRDTPARAALEAHVLRVLHDHGAPVPALLGLDGRWLAQTSLGETRLSTALRHGLGRDSTGDDRAAWLDAALTSLAAIHAIAAEAGLAREVYRIGAAAGWLDRLIAMPARVGAVLGVPAPELDTARLRQRLAPGVAHFIKWDARPPNAMLQADGGIAWFDWEHCGCRNPLDDMAWLLCDEAVPEAPAAEARLVQRHLDRFRHGRPAAEAEFYLRAFGALHMAVRLSVMTADCWPDPDAGAARQFRRLCRRGQRWAALAPETAPLAVWFAALAGLFPESPTDNRRRP